MEKVEAMEIEQRLRTEGAKVDPATVPIEWWYAATLDPYGIRDLPPELQQVGRMYFVRSEIGWVSF